MLFIPQLKFLAFLLSYFSTFFWYCLLYKFIIGILIHAVYAFHLFASHSGSCSNCWRLSESWLGRGMLRILAKVLGIISQRLSWIMYIVSLTFWQDFPEDLTGNLDLLKEFVRSNFEMCKWIGLSIVSIQVRVLEHVFGFGQLLELSTLLLLFPFSFFLFHYLLDSGSLGFSLLYLFIYNKVGFTW